MKTVIFFGTPLFSVNVLKTIFAENYNIKYVVTQPDKQVGRKKQLVPSPVKKFALEHNLEVLQPAKLTGSEEESKIISTHADLLITAAFGQFLSDQLLQSANIAAINFHASLLPKYRGAAPIQYAILNGDKETGITIMEMVKKMDAGDIFSQKRINIAPDDNLASLTDKLGSLAVSMVKSDLPKLFQKNFSRTPQDESKVTFAPSITPEQEQIDFSNSLTHVLNQIRSLSPTPGAYLLHEGKRIKIYAAKGEYQKVEGKPGSVGIRDKKQLGIVTSDHQILLLQTIQVQGGKKVSVNDYLNGVGKNLKIGDQFVD